MLSWSIKLNKNYALDIAGFYKMRDFDDGVSFIDIDVNLDTYVGDHNPKFGINLVLLNFMLLDISVYNVNHAPDDPEDEEDDKLETEKEIPCK